MCGGNPSLKQAEARSRFWLIAAAVKAFYAQHGRLPVPGNIPDMKAESDVYVRLQHIYKKKAQEDAAEVMTMVQSIAKATFAAVTLDGSYATNDEISVESSVDLEEVEMFCKNAAFAKLINTGDRDPNLLQSVVGMSCSFFFFFGFNSFRNLFFQYNALVVVTAISIF